MSFLENPKQYTGQELETIFFRPMLSGPSAQELGVRILYNMPVPTTVQLWDGRRDILQKYTAAGWSGGETAHRYQKTIQLSRVKAELGFSAADYFAQVYELIAARADVNMEDLTGTELEQAETTLFKQAVAEGIRATMWMGDSAGEAGLNTFDGFLKALTAFAASEEEEDIHTFSYTSSELSSPSSPRRTSATSTRSTSTRRAPTPPTSTRSTAAARSPTTAFLWSTSAWVPTSPTRPIPSRSAC